MTAPTTSPAPISTTDAGSSWLAHVPVGLFASVMGLAGLGLAWRTAHELLAWPAWIGEALLALAAVSFAGTALIYALRALRYPALFLGDCRHPLRSSFLAAITVGAMLLSIGLDRYAPGLAPILWFIAATSHLIIAVLVMAQWCRRNHEIQHSNPAWFIPVVGNIVAPIGGVLYGFPEYSWFFFSVGVVFWLVLFPILLNRILFHGQMPAKLLPTLFILLAPPAVSCVAYLGLNGGQPDALVRILLYTGLFIGLLLLALAPMLAKVPFALSWWAYTFPAAAISIAVLRGGHAIGGAFLAQLGPVLLILASVVVLTVSARTLTALIGGRLFLPEN